MLGQDLLKAAQEYGIDRLRRETGLSRSHIYGILSGETEPKLSTYRKLIEPLGFTLSVHKKAGATSSEKTVQHDLQYLRWSLAYWGAPLLAEGDYKKPLDLSTTLLQALLMGRKNSDINAILPFFIYKNRRKFDLEKIGLETSEPHYFAYLLNLLTHMRNDLEMIETCLKIKNRSPLAFSEQRLIQRGKINPFETAKFARVENRIAKTWGFQTFDNLTDIEERFNKWAANL